MTVFSSRIKSLRSRLRSHQLLVLSRAADIQYYTGFICINPEEREAFFVLSEKSAVLLYPSFSPVQKVKEISYHTGNWPTDLGTVVTEIEKKESITEVLLDKGSLFLNEFEALSENTAKKIALDRHWIWHDRMAKDESELVLLRRASQITAKVMDTVLERLKPGVTEEEVARWVRSEVLNEGAETTSFPSVIAFGAHAALPHHQPTDVKLKNNTVVLIDIGAKFSGYCGDMTRTIWFGDKPSDEFKKIETVVKQAYEKAVETLKADISGAIVDKAARSVIEAEGYAKNFIHTTGHGVGLEIHEHPSLYFKKDVALLPGTVVTIEPGIYLEGKFGYRYENMVLVETEEASPLTGNLV